MKSILPLLYWLAFVPFGSAMGGPTLPNFGDNKLELPPRTLADQTKYGPPAPPSAPVKEPLAWIKKRVPDSPLLVSRMPLIVPANVCSRMPIIIPDSAVDYKMIVKEPTIMSVK